MDLNEVSINSGTVMHAVAEHGLPESAKELLSRGYHGMLQKNRGDAQNTWPLVLAIDYEQWATVKVILESLNLRLEAEVQY